MQSFEQDLIINFTPTGIIPTKEMTPHVPVSPKEIIDDVLRANEIGISMVHLHARDENNNPTLNDRIYGEIIAGIKKYASDLIICVSTGGRNNQNLCQRLDPLCLDKNLKPDMASLTLSSLNFNKQASINDPDTIKILAQEMKEQKIKPELEIFDLGMANYMKYLISKEILTPPYYVNIILGNIACAQANPLHVGVLLNDIPECLWSIGGIGSFQLPMNSMSIAIGGGVRVGLEDNIWYDRQRTKLATNIDLLKRIHVLANANERKLMTPKQLRQKLGM